MLVKVTSFDTSCIDHYIKNSQELQKNMLKATEMKMLNRKDTGNSNDNPCLVASYFKTLV